MEVYIPHFFPLSGLSDLIRVQDARIVSAFKLSHPGSGLGIAYIGTSVPPVQA